MKYPQKSTTHTFLETKNLKPCNFKRSFRLVLSICSQKMYRFISIWSLIIFKSRVFHSFSPFLSPYLFLSHSIFLSCKSFQYCDCLVVTSLPPTPLSSPFKFSISSFIEWRFIIKVSSQTELVKLKNANLQISNLPAEILDLKLLCNFGVLCMVLNYIHM